MSDSLSVSKKLLKLLRMEEDRLAFMLNKGASKPAIVAQVNYVEHIRSQIVAITKLETPQIIVPIHHGPTQNPPQSPPQSSPPKSYDSFDQAVHAEMELLKAELTKDLYGPGDAPKELKGLKALVDAKWDDHDEHLKAYEAFVNNQEPYQGQELKSVIYDELGGVHDISKGVNPYVQANVDSSSEKFTLNKLTAAFKDLGVLSYEQAQHVQGVVNDKLQQQAPSSGQLFYKPKIGLMVTGLAWNTLKNASPWAQEWDWDWHHVSDIDVYELVGFDKPVYPSTHPYQFFCWGGPLHGKEVGNKVPELMTVWPTQLTAHIATPISEGTTIPMDALELKKHLYFARSFVCELPYRVVRLVSMVDAHPEASPGALKSYTEQHGEWYVLEDAIKEWPNWGANLLEKWKGDMRVDFAHFEETVWIAEEDMDDFLATLKVVELMLGWGIGLIAEVAESSG